MKVVSKQTNSKSCIICGMENPLGVKAQFYNMEDGTVASIFQFKFEHQSYPQRVHGGMISAMLDELIGRVLWVKEPDTYGVTTSLTVKFRKPVPYDTQLKARATMQTESARFFTAHGEIFDMQGNLLAEAEGNYLKLPPEKITDGVDVNEEMCYEIEDEITDIEF